MTTHNITFTAQRNENAVSLNRAVEVFNPKAVKNEQDADLFLRSAVALNGSIEQRACKVLEMLNDNKWYTKLNNPKTGKAFNSISEYGDSLHGFSRATVSQMLTAAKYLDETGVYLKRQASSIEIDENGDERIIKTKIPATYSQVYELANGLKDEKLFDQAITSKAVLDEYQTEIDGQKVLAYKLKPSAKLRAYAKAETKGDDSAKAIEKTFVLRFTLDELHKLQSIVNCPDFLISKTAVVLAEITEKEKKVKAKKENK